MKTISVGQLRQNPTAALADVAAGETYSITRHNREIGRITPPQATVALIPAKKTGGARLAALPRHELRTASSVDELLADDKGDW